VANINKFNLQKQKKFVFFGIIFMLPFVVNIFHYPIAALPAQ